MTGLGAARSFLQLIGYCYSKRCKEESEELVAELHFEVGNKEWFKFRVLLLDQIRVEDNNKKKWDKKERHQGSVDLYILTHVAFQVSYTCTPHRDRQLDILFYVTWSFSCGVQLPVGGTDTAGVGSNGQH